MASRRIRSRKTGILGSRDVIEAKASARRHAHVYAEVPFSPTRTAADSVIVCTYTESADCLQSASPLEEDRLSGLEVIVVDDGSTINSPICAAEIYGSV